MKSVRKAVIPCAGLGTRFLPVTKVVPKELFPIGNKPVIQYVVEEAVASGVEEIILVCNPKKPAIVDYFRPAPELIRHLEGKGKKKEAEELRRIESLARFTVVYQKEPLGLGHSVLCAQKAVGGESFLVILPDVLVQSEVPACRQLTEACKDPRGGGWGLLLERVPSERVNAYGIVKVNEVGGGRYRLQGAVEKPSPTEAPSNLAILGRYLLPPMIFELIEQSAPGALGEIQLTDGIEKLCGREVGYGLLARGRTFDVGTVEGVEEFVRSIFLPT